MMMIIVSMSIRILSVLQPAGVLVLLNGSKNNNKNTNGRKCELNGHWICFSQSSQRYALSLHYKLSLAETYQIILSSTKLVDCAVVVHAFHRSP